MKKLAQIVQALILWLFSVMALVAVSLLAIRLLIRGDYRHDPSAFGAFGLAAMLAAPIWLPLSAIFSIPLALALNCLMSRATRLAKTQAQSSAAVLGDVDPL